MTKRTIQTLLITSAMLASCKPPGASRVKTLENFAFGKNVRINACAAPEDQLEARDPRKKVAVFIDVKDAKLAKQVSSELILALSAVPDAAFRIFQAKNGKVLVTPDVAGICAVGGAVKFNGQSPVASTCVIDTPFQTQSGKFERAMSGTTLVVAPDATAIRHGVVRSMGHVVADTLVLDPGFALLRVELAKAFLSDMTTSSIFSLKAHEGLLGPGIDNIVRKNLADNVGNLLKGANTTSDRVNNFMSLVLGEAFDSYYCRTGGTALFPRDVADRIKEPKDAPLFAYLTDTRLVMSYFFPRTYSTFRLVEAHMEGFAAQFPVPQFRNGAKQSSSAGGFQLTQGGGSENALALTGGGRQTVGSRAAELEQLIRQNATLTRETYEQWQQKKASYDGAWTDVWGTKKGEMDVARGSYRVAQAREQALLQELQQVRDEEKRLGSGARTSSDRQFNVPDLKVGTFDFNAELAKGVQATAKRYGDNVGAVTSTVNGIQGRGLGFVAGMARSGTWQGGMDGAKYGEEIGAAWGKGIGDGVGGILGSFGKLTTDSIASTGQSVTDAQKFATDLAVDPMGTAARKGREYVDSTIARAERVQQFGRDVYNGDFRAVGSTLNSTLENTTGVGTLYKTGQNVWNFANARTPQEADAAIKRQFDTAAEGLSNAGSAAFSSAQTAVANTKAFQGLKKATRYEDISNALRSPGEKAMSFTATTLAPVWPGSSGHSKVLGVRTDLANGWKNANGLIGALNGEGLDGFTTSPTGAMVAGINSTIKGKTNDVRTFKPTLTPVDNRVLGETSPIAPRSSSYSPTFKTPTSSGGQGALIPYKSPTSSTTTFSTPSSGPKPYSFNATMGSGLGSSTSIYSPGSAFGSSTSSYSFPSGYRPAGNLPGSGTTYVSP